MEWRDSEGEWLDPYLVFAREEATDRRRLRVAAIVALVLHGFLLLAPLPPRETGRTVEPPRSSPSVFPLRDVRFAPPRPDPVDLDPPAPPAPVELGESASRGSPAEEPAAASFASIEVLVPRGTEGTLVPPQPLSTPPPAYPPELARQGIRGEVLLTVVVDGEGQVREVTVDEGPEALGELAAAAIRRWLFLPGSLSGNPLTTAVRVRATFPGTAAAIEDPEDGILSSSPGPQPH